MHRKGTIIVFYNYMFLSCELLKAFVRFFDSRELDSLTQVCRPWFERDVPFTHFMKKAEWSHAMVYSGSFPQL